MKQVMQLSPEGVKLIKHSEGLRLKAYPCSARKMTIGWGHTKGVFAGMEITLQKAEQFFKEDVRLFEADVNSLLTVPVTQGQFDALVSFAFNLGSDIDADTIAEGLGDSTLLKKVNAGDFEGAAREFMKWVSAGPKGKRKVQAGLVIRRQRELAMFRGE